MYIDTHCHLNFKAFEGGEKKIVRKASDAGVGVVVVPGADIQTSEKALEIAGSLEKVYAVVGIHPHHASRYTNVNIDFLEKDIDRVEEMIKHEKVVGVGEIGLDRHPYRESRYGREIVIDEALFALQKLLFVSQFRLAVKYQNAVVIHNRETADDMLHVLETELHDEIAMSSKRMVFHCCESHEGLLAYAKQNRVYIGVDGDVTYSPEKENFIRQVPLDLLVLETDSPYLLPEPLRSRKRSTNEPANIPLIATKIAEIKHIDIAQVEEVTTHNAKYLFNL